MTQTKNNSNLVAIIVMMFLFGMISFVTNMAAPFGTIWKISYEWAGMVGNLMNFAAYLFMGIPAGIMVTKMGYKKTALVALALGFVGVGVQFLSSTMDGAAFGTYLVYLAGAFICGFCVCILNTVVNPMLNILGGGGNKGNQYIQIGGSMNSLAGTFTPMLAGMMIGQITPKTAMSDVSPLLLIAMGIFAVSFGIIYITKLVEPEQANEDIMPMIKGALGFRQLVLGIIAIFFYVGIEVGIPGEMIFYISSMDIPNATAVAGSIAGLYWFLMLVGRLTSSFISGAVSSRAQLTTVTIVAIAFLLIAIFIPESNTFNININLGFLSIENAEVPVKCLFFILCGLCTSVMWGTTFNLATEGLGKYTAAASGLFMTMVVGGGVMPFIQDLAAGAIGFVQSYWIVIAMLVYMLFYAQIGSRTSKN